MKKTIKKKKVIKMSDGGIVNPYIDYNDINEYRNSADNNAGASGYDSVLAGVQAVPGVVGLIGQGVGIMDKLLQPVKENAELMDENGNFVNRQKAERTYAVGSSLNPAKAAGYWFGQAGDDNGTGTKAGNIGRGLSSLFAPGISGIFTSKKYAAERTADEKFAIAEEKRIKDEDTARNRIGFDADRARNNKYTTEGSFYAQGTDNIRPRMGLGIGVRDGSGNGNGTRLLDGSGMKRIGNGFEVNAKTKGKDTVPMNISGQPVRVDDKEIIIPKNNGSVAVISDDNGEADKYRKEIAMGRNKDMVTAKFVARAGMLKNKNTTKLAGGTDQIRSASDYIANNFPNYKFRVNDRYTGDYANRSSDMSGYRDLKELEVFGGLDYNKGKPNGLRSIQGYPLMYKEPFNGTSEQEYNPIGNIKDRYKDFNSDLNKSTEQEIAKSVMRPKVKPVVKPITTATKNVDASSIPGVIDGKLQPYTKQTNDFSLDNLDKSIDPALHNAKGESLGSEVKLTTTVYDPDPNTKSKVLTKQNMSTAIDIGSAAITAFSNKQAMNKLNNLKYPEFNPSPFASMNIDANKSIYDNLSSDIKRQGSNINKTIVNNTANSNTALANIAANKADTVTSISKVGAERISDRNRIANANAQGMNAYSQTISQQRQMADQGKYANDINMINTSLALNKSTMDTIQGIRAKNSYMDLDREKLEWISKKYGIDTSNPTNAKNSALDNLKKYYATLSPNSSTAIAVKQDIDELSKNINN